MDPMPPSSQKPVPEAIHYARIARPELVARPAQLFLSRWLMSRRAAWIDLACIGAAIAFAFAVIIVALSSGLLALLDGTGIIFQAFTIGAISLATVAALLRWRGQGVDAIGLGRTPVGPALGWGLVSVLAAYAVNLLLMAVFLALFQEQGLKSAAEEKSNLFDAIAAVPAAWILPATLFVGFYEEVVFRGLILSRLRVLCKGVVAPVIISAVLFGLLHGGQGPIGVLQATAIGAVFASLAAWRRNVWPCIIAHSLLDTIPFVLARTFAPMLKEFMKDMPQ